MIWYSLSNQEGKKLTVIQGQQCAISSERRSFRVRNKWLQVPLIPNSETFCHYQNTLRQLEMLIYLRPDSLQEQSLLVNVWTCISKPSAISSFTCLLLPCLKFSSLFHQCMTITFHSGTAVKELLLSSCYNKKQRIALLKRQ